jgi:hypothetical protein
VIYTTLRGEAFDTEKDCSAAERHILQKLFLWKDMAAGVEEFKAKKQQALRQGWDNSGPSRERPALRAITRDLEDRVARGQSGTG